MPDTCHPGVWRRQAGHLDETNAVHFCGESWQRQPPPAPPPPLLDPPGCTAACSTASSIHLKQSGQEDILLLCFICDYICTRSVAIFLTLYIPENLILYCRFCSEVDDDNHYIGKHCTDCISTFKNTNILPDLSFFGRLLFTLPHLWSHWSIIITAAEQRSDCIRGSRTLLLLLLGRKL